MIDDQTFTSERSLNACDHLPRLEALFMSAAAADSPLFSSPPPSPSITRSQMQPNTSDYPQPRCHHPETTDHPQPHHHSAQHPQQSPCISSPRSQMQPNTSHYPQPRCHHPETTDHPQPHHLQAQHPSHLAAHHPLPCQC